MNVNRPNRPPTLRRAWLFVPGLHSSVHSAALQSDADVIVADLEEMTSAQDRQAARDQIVTLLSQANNAGILGAVRINKLEHDGHADLEGVMAGIPHAIFLPHTETESQLAALCNALSSWETQLRLLPGSTEIVPTIESAKGLVNLRGLLCASPRIRCCMLAVEDLAANLGARRTPGVNELLYARSRFLIECIASDVVPIDLPCTYESETALVDDLKTTTQLGFTAKCVVSVSQVETVNRALTPTEADAALARSIIEAYRGQQAGSVPALQARVESPERNNAVRLIARHEALMEVRRNRGEQP